MKLKKLVSAVACVVMAGVFATSAFAATTDQVAAAQGYLSANGISYEISSEEVDKIIANFKTEDAAKAAGDALIAQVKADPNNAASIVTNALAGYGVTVSDVAVTVNADGTISGTATINGKAASATVAGAATSEHPEIGANKDENGNWHVDEATTDAAASVTTQRHQGHRRQLRCCPGRRRSGCRYRAGPGCPQEQQHRLSPVP